MNYRLDPGHSRFTVKTCAGGLLSFAAHSPTFIVREFSGSMEFDPEANTGSVKLTIPARALDLMDQVSPSDRREIMTRMQHEVLEIELFPEISYAAPRITARHVRDNQYQARADGELTLHGITATEPVEAELRLHHDGARLTGTCTLRMPDYRIKPVTALGGAIRLKDELKLQFDLVGWKEGMKEKG